MQKHVKKNEKNTCRFNFPMPPMHKTMVLQPLAKDDLHEDELDEIKTNSALVIDKLARMKYGSLTTYEQFVEEMNLTNDQYIKAIQYTLQRDTLFLKRSPAEIRVNSYNVDLLKAWRANMDIQYVLDPYACAVYILSYITKGQRGMSKLLEKASEEAKLGNQTLLSQIRHIGNKFLNSVEISAQEAVYLVLQMPLRRSSRDVVFINTSNPEERTFLLKSKDQINALPDNSENIESDNLIKRYQRRPNQLKHVCLAEFAAWYNCVHHKSKQSNTENPNDFLAECDFDPNVDDDFSDDEQIDLNQKEYQLKGGLTLVKRSTAKVIRSVRFRKANDPENYFREQLMLYAPWRNEFKDLLGTCKSYLQMYESLEHLILKNKQQFEFQSDILDKAIEEISNKEDSENPIAECNKSVTIAPNTQHLDEQDQLAQVNCLAVLIQEKIQITVTMI